MIRPHPFSELSSVVPKLRLTPHLLWIYLLCVLGGYFNAGAILLHQVPASHHTGNVSHIALFLHKLNHISLAEVGGVILAFVLGSTIAGLLFHDRIFKPTHRYGLTLMGMGVILAAAALLNFHDHKLLLFLGAAFMGLQNGLFIYYKNMLVRSTHVTGTLTDFGFALGCMLRGKHHEWIRVIYHGCAILSFFLGGLLAPFVLKMGPRAFWLGLSAGYITGGLIYYYLRAKNHFMHVHEHGPGHAGAR